MESINYYIGNNKEITINLRSKRNPLAKINTLTETRTEVIYRKLQQTSSMQHLFNINKRDAAYGNTYDYLKSKGILIESDY